MASFEVNSVKINTLLSYVDDGVIAIPEIQRPFVWDATKVRDLIDSLYKGYPVGYIITWKNPNVKLKDGTISEGKQILIDGQQRVTALSAAIRGNEVLNSQYKKKRIKIAFNIKNEIFAVSTPAHEKSNEWISDIATLMNDKVLDTFQFCTDYAKIANITPNEVNQRLNKLNEILNLGIGRIELSSKIDIDTVTEIFVRINSKGVPLSQADFALSKISVNEEYEGNDIRKVIDYFSHFLETPQDFDSIKNYDKEFASKEVFSKIAWASKYTDNLYKPSYVDILRVAFTYKFKRGKLQDLVSLLSGRDFETREFKEEIIEKSFSELYSGVKDFVNETNYKRYIMIVKSSGIINEDLIRSQNVLNFGYILYLLMKEKGYDASIIENSVRRWVVYSILTERYSGSPESRFDYDVKRLANCENIPSYIKMQEEAELSEAYWNKILVDKFNTSVTSSPYWRMFVVSQIKLSNRAFLSKSMTVRDLVEQRGDVHHIFPKDYLIKSGINTMQQYNQIANYVYLQQEINIQISNLPPIEYFNKLEQQVNGGNSVFGCIDNKEDLVKNLKENAIPESVMNMTYDNFEEFLSQRRVLMANKVKDYFYSL
ncbi:MAG: DUF262 domain-containing protein [Candidatus Caccovivens sp.]